MNPKKGNPKIMAKARPVEDGVSIAIDYYREDLDRRYSAEKENEPTIEKIYVGSPEFIFSRGVLGCNHFDSLVNFAHLPTCIRTFLPCGNPKKK